MIQQEIKKANGMSETDSGKDARSHGSPTGKLKVKQYLKTGRYDDLPWDEKRKIAIEHAKLAFRIKGEHGLIELRKQLLWYVKGLPNATGYRSQLVQLKTVKEIKKALMGIKPN